ncbi:hypothetical protein BC941DRAFT_6699 [Chlamydoabsidia padenii]|nr:hypothetical protein BC941DRAFT_6699 [Chlamydoabsidia padenii]
MWLCLCFLSCCLQAGFENKLFDARHPFTPDLKHSTYCFASGFPVVYIESIQKHCSLMFFSPRRKENKGFVDGSQADSVCVTKKKSGMPR